MNKSSCIIPLFHAGSGECLELDNGEMGTGIELVEKMS